MECPQAGSGIAIPDPGHMADGDASSGNQPGNPGQSVSLPVTDKAQ
jgi:hypothetical protein